jgi:hypothetical protein
MYRAPTHREKIRRGKKRGAWGDHKRLVYYFNVNRTSLDHLLLGGSADVDRMSSGHSIAREGEIKKIALLGRRSDNLKGLPADIERYGNSGIY